MSPERGRAPLESAASLFAALADPTRLRVVARLCSGGPMSIARLSEGAGVTRQAISRHLQVLADAGLVQCTRRGRESVYQLEPAPLDDARRFLDRISREWDASLDRLRAFVED